MPDLLDLSTRIIDHNITDVAVNRVTNELSELTSGLAIVESFSHSVVLRTDDGLVAFDASGARSGSAVSEAIAHWSPAPVSHLVYTHGHLDHVGGSGAFARRWGPPTVIGHANVDARLDRYELTNDWGILINARQFGGIRQDAGVGLSMAPAGELDPSRWHQFVPPGTLRPDVKVGDQLLLSVGGADIELFHARGETDDHLWAWLPEQRAVIAGDFVIWNFPNAGNPQKVQRYPIEWAAALRSMVAMQPDLLVPAHGLPIAGRDRIAGVLHTIADTLDRLVADVLEMMNAGATLDEIVHTVRVAPDVLALPFMRPLYDEPEFVVRNVWRLFGGWWDGAASRLKPAPDAELAVVLGDLIGGPAVLMRRAALEAESGNFRIACHLADFAGWAAPDEPDIHRRRAEIYRARRASEPSLMSKGIFAAAALQSEAVAERHEQS